MSRDSIADLIAELTLEEKVSLVHGATDEEGTATGYIPGVERLDIPPVRLSDGPLGVRTDEPSTAFPASIALASAFDADLAREFGEALGREANARNQDVMLAPGLNLIRVPHCGRNFEYYSEDPVLAGSTAAGVVSGIQSQDVVATPKHYVANNQETARASVSVEADERVLRELYLPAFHDAVDAGAGSVMSSYNRVGGTYVSEHHHLLTEVLKEEWGFEGYVVSDWFGTESVVGTANDGLDLQMPGISAEELFASMGMDEGDGPDHEGGDFDEMDHEGGDFDEMDHEGGDFDESGPGDFEFADGMPDPTTGGLYSEDLADAVESGEVPESRLDDMVARILGALDDVGHFADDDREGAIDTPVHRELARIVATRGTVLLENDGALPLADDADVALLGPNVDEAILGGGGSSETTPFVESTPVEGVEGRAGGEVTVARGIERVEDVSMFEGFGPGDEDEGDEPEVAIDDAVAAAEASDVAVVFVRDQATEAADRESLALPGDQDELVEAVAAANENTVVVLNTSGPVELPWREEVAAVLASWYPGQAHGDAAAAVLYGDADPGGRLPVTFAPESEYPANTEERFPGVDGEVHYDEGLLVGYRHFDATDAEPTYPFGHGESYAEFDYGEVERVDDATVDVGGAVEIAVEVENVADRRGREVVQAYVDSPSAPDDLERPPREFAGSAAIELGPGESATVTLALDERAFGRWTVEAGWKTDSGEHVVEVGRSSRDLVASVSVER